MNTNRKVPEDADKHYQIIDFLLVFTTISTLVKCAQYSGKVSFKSCAKEGLEFEIKVTCPNCEPRYVPSSQRVGRSYEVNTRFVFVMRILGLGLAACNKFCGLMDLASQFLSKPSYSDTIKKICSSVKVTAAKFIFSPSKEE